MDMLYHLLVEALINVQTCSGCMTVCIRYWVTLIQILIVMQLPLSHWVEEGQVGGTKSPILFVTYDLHRI